MATARARPGPAGPAVPAAAGLDPRGIVLLLAVLAAARVFYAWLLPFASEDAYITFRYARHLAMGLGLVFNPGERVFGITSVPWTLWMALGERLQIDLVDWSRVNSALLDAITLVAGMRLLARAASSQAAWAFGVLIAGWPFFSALSASGLELSLVLALLVAGVERMDRAPRFAGGLLGLLALSRPEGALATLVCARWAPRRTTLIALAIALVGYGALWLYYGSPIPNSVVAKAEAYGLPGPWVARGWWDWLLPFDIGRIPAFDEARQWWPFRVIALPAAALGVKVLWRHRALAIPAACGAVTAAYALTGTAYFWWYFSLPALGLAFAAAAGLREIIRGPWVAISAALFVAGTWTILPWTVHRGRITVEAETFIDVAAYLREHAGRGDTVLLEPLGHIGWLNPELRLVDEVGLVAPEIARRRARGDGWYTATIAAERPRWLVVRAPFLTLNEPFTGRGKPFLSRTQRDSVLAGYELVYVAADSSEASFRILERRATDATHEPR